MRDKGYTALKTNVILFDGVEPRVHSPGLFQTHAQWPERNIDAKTLQGIVELLSAFRQGAGEGMGLMVDLNFNFRPESMRRIARALEPFNLAWLEFDLHDPVEIAQIRSGTTLPIASLETIYGERGIRPYLEARAVEFAIIDVQWNGMVNAMHMANLADSFSVNIAAHNYHGYLSTLMGAHLCAAVPNFRAMEFVVDEVPWMNDFMTHPLEFENSQMLVPQRPGSHTPISRYGFSKATNVRLSVRGRSTCASRCSFKSATNNAHAALTGAGAAPVSYTMPR